MDNKSYPILGVDAHPKNLKALNQFIENQISNDSRNTIVGSLNLHGLYLFHKSEKLRNFHQKSVKRIDGMPIVWIGKALGYPLEREHRVTWVDWIYPLMEEAKKKSWSIYYVGSEEAVLEKVKPILKNKFRDLNISFRNGFFDAKKNSEESNTIIHEINNSGANILIVGMGMPRQEYWIYDHIEKFDVNVILTSGAALEYVAGTVKTPPRWMGKAGLEWLYRLLEHPKRFAFRYIIEPWYILVLFMIALFNKYVLKKET